jgi:hypothetical protein
MAPNTTTCSTGFDADETLSTRLRTAAAELGQRPVELRGLADRCVTVLERDRVHRQVLDARERELRALAQDDLRRCREQRLRAAGGRGAREVLDDRRLRARPELDDRPRQQPPARLAGRPSHDDGAVELDAGRDLDHDPLVPGGAGQLGELVVGGQRRAGRQQALCGGRVLANPVPQRRDRDAGRPGGADLGARRVLGRAVGVDGFQVGRPQVDVRRVELIRLGRQVVEQRQGGSPVGREPVGLVGGECLDESRIRRE